jgi:3-hydroxyacyl-[acyl-carrier-protein] dehydratase
MTGHRDLHGLLPHRHPTLLVDRILEESLTARGSESWLVAVKAVTASEPCYAGVDEGAAASAYAYPAALILESFIQSAAALWARVAQEAGRPHEGTLFFAGARHVRMHDPVQPGDRLLHRVRLDDAVGATAFLSGTTSLADRSGVPVLTVGSLVLAVRALPEPTTEEPAGVPALEDS